MLTNIPWHINANAVFFPTSDIQANKIRLLTNCDDNLSVNKYVGLSTGFCGFANRRGADYSAQTYVVPEGKWFDDGGL